MLYQIYPLVVPERPFPEARPAKERDSPLPLPSSRVKEPRFPPTDLVTRLTFGELPGIAVAPRRDRAELLRAYSLVYLEEELRREALIKDWAAFSRFLRLAAAESGHMLNYAKIAKEAGMKPATLAIAWVLRQPAVTAPIIGASRPEQLEDTLAAAEVQLEHDLVARLDTLTREFRRGDAAR